MTLSRSVGELDWQRAELMKSAEAQRTTSGGARRDQWEFILTLRDQWDAGSSVNCILLPSSEEVKCPSR
jgi:hypothetical protein